jgi:hypothetical protein
MSDRYSLFLSSDDTSSSAVSSLFFSPDDISSSAVKSSAVSVNPPPTEAFWTIDYLCIRVATRLSTASGGHCMTPIWMVGSTAVNRVRDTKDLNISCLVHAVPRPQTFTFDTTSKGFKKALSSR